MSETCSKIFRATEAATFVGCMRRESDLGFACLGFAQHRQDGLYTLREPVPPYGDHFDMGNEALTLNKTVPWKTNLETTEA
jgi:hypothetical protein